MGKNKTWEMEKCAISCRSLLILYTLREPQLTFKVGSFAPALYGPFLMSGHQCRKYSPSRPLRCGYLEGMCDENELSNVRC